VVRMKLRFRFRYYEGYMGVVGFDGTIDIDPRLLSKPMVLVSIVLHELIHWTLDAVGLYGKVHDWNDLLYSYVGLYDYDVNRATLRKTIRSGEWNKLAQENLARREVR